MKKPGFIAESFDPRTLRRMDIALENACHVLGHARDDYDSRRHIADRILACAAGGERSLRKLSEAGCTAATELCASHGV